MDTTVTCSQCDEEIRQVNGFWMHVATQPRHPAIPVGNIGHGPWYNALDPRQKAMVDHAISYAYNYSRAGVPGHGAHLLIAKLAEELDKASETDDATI